MAKSGASFERKVVAAVVRALKFSDAASDRGWSVYVYFWKAVALVVAGVLVAAFVWFVAIKLWAVVIGSCPAYC
jgi:hypothetical protein